MTGERVLLGGGEASFLRGGGGENEGFPRGVEVRGGDCCVTGEEAFYGGGSERVFLEGVRIVNDS